MGVELLAFMDIFQTNQIFRAVVRYKSEAKIVLDECALLGEPNLVQGKSFLRGTLATLAYDKLHVIVIDDLEHKVPRIPDRK